MQTLNLALLIQIVDKLAVLLVKFLQISLDFAVIPPESISFGLISLLECTPETQYRIDEIEVFEVLTCVAVHEMGKTVGFEQKLCEGGILMGSVIRGVLFDVV